MCVVAPIVCGGSLFCGVLLGKLYSLSNILLIIRGWLLYFNCVVVVCVSSWVGLQSAVGLKSAMGWSAVYDCGISWSYSLTVGKLKPRVS